MLTVHHLGISQSERIVWLCEELGLDYTLQRWDRRSDNRLAPDGYKALHPMGIAPVIADGDLVLAESGAICDYINAKYGQNRLAPGIDDPDFVGHLFWFHWSNGTFMATMMMGMAVQMSGGSPDTPLVKLRSERCWAMIEQRLGEVEYFGGAKLTTADIMMVFCLTTMRNFGAVSLDNMPNVKAYLARIGTRPAYQKAMAKAEPGMPLKLT